MTRRLRAVAAVVAIAALGWLGCPRAPRPPLSVAEGMKTAERVPLVRGTPSYDSPTLIGEAPGTLDASRGRVDWKVIDFPATPGEVHISIRHRGADDSVLFEVFDEGGAPLASATPEPRPAGSVDPIDYVRVEVSPAAGRLYVRVYAATPGAPTRYDLDTYYRELIVAVDAAPPCDPKHIDIDNPNCDDVNPWCDPNAPDFTNPACCVLARCQESLCGGGGITDLQEANGGVIARLGDGAKFGVVRGTYGELALSVEGREAVVRGGDVAVYQVFDDHSMIEVRLPEGVRLEQVTHAWARIFPPVDCVIPRRAAD